MTEAMKDSVTCMFDLRKTFNVGSQAESLSKALMDLMRVDIGDEHIDDFLDIPAAQIMDSIMKPSIKSVKYFRVDYIKLVPYTRNTKSFIHNMNGNGIFTFSSTSMGKDNKRVAVYYEYTCGLKYGIGEIVILKLAEGKWKIIKTLTCWQS